MRVALLNRPLTGWRGGDLIGVAHRLSALRAIGVDAEYVDCKDSLAAFDIAHVFHLDHTFCRRNFEAVQRDKKRYVVTPIFYPEISGDNKVKGAWLRGAAAILPFSRAEGEELRTRFGNDIQYTAIPSGTAPEFYAEPSPDRVGVCASDISGSKNSHIIERACRELGIPFTRFKEIPSKEMPAKFRAHRVFCHATHSDRMSLAVGEALCSGCRVITTPNNRGNEHYPGIRTVPKWDDGAGWVAAIREAYSAPEWDWTPNVAARALTWESQAEGYKAAYERALA